MAVQAPGNSVVLVGPRYWTASERLRLPDAGDTEQQFRFTVIPPACCLPILLSQLPSCPQVASWVLGRAVCVVSSDPNNNNYYYYSGPSQVLSVKVSARLGL